MTSSLAVSVASCFGAESRRCLHRESECQCATSNGGTCLFLKVLAYNRNIDDGRDSKAVEGYRVAYPRKLRKRKALNGASGNDEFTTSARAVGEAAVDNFLNWIPETATEIMAF